MTFDTCFPGWYSSRTIHIHFTVRRPSHSGTAYVTSQLFFDQTLINEICSTHPDYVAHGLPDTTNANDTVAPKSGLATYLLDTARMSDGAMLASKTVVVRSSTSVANCSA